MPPSRVVTAVALYGTKTGALKRLLEEVQAISIERLRGGFYPYTLDQIHSTVTRLDGVTDPQTGLIVNQRYLELTGTSRTMDYARALEILATCLTPPLSIRIGGFGPGSTTAFTSRGQHPYERSFSAQGDAFVLMGWPESTITSGISQRPLDELRRKMNEAGIMHWYHESPTDIDNDFHLVVGHRSSASRRKTAEAVHAVRAYLARHPIQIAVGINQMTIISANSPTLAPAQFIGRFPVDPMEVADLYH